MEVSGQLHATSGLTLMVEMEISETLIFNSTLARLTT
jgi:hypothetical protein